MKVRKQFILRTCAIAAFVIYFILFAVSSMQDFAQDEFHGVFELCRAEVTTKDFSGPVALPVKISPENEAYTEFEFTLSRDFTKERLLCFRTSGQSVSVYLNNSQIYNFTFDQNVRYGSKKLNIVHLPKYSEGKVLRVSLRTVFTGQKKVPEFYVCESYDQIFAKYLIRYIGDAFIAIFGLLLILGYLLTRKKTSHNREYVALGILSILFAAWIYIGTDDYVILPNVSLSNVSQLSYFLFILMIIPVQYYISILCRNMYQPLMNALKTVSYLNIVVVTLLQLSGICYLYETLFTTHILLAFTAIASLFFVIRDKEKLWKRQKAIAFGFAIFALTTVVELVCYYVFMDSYQIGRFVRIAFIIFLVCHLVQMFQNYMQAGEREIEQKAYSESLHNQLFLAQLKPQFLYSMMGTILHQVKQDSQEGYRSLQSLAYYLRNNMELLDGTTTIPIVKEMENVESYLRLEKLRLKDKLEYRIDMQEMNFFVAPYGVQLLVENAVRYGASKNVGGGVIEIKTYREGSDFVIAISDDGPGFDEQAVAYEQDKKKQGIRIARDRIAQLSGGSIQIKSVLGKGTWVKILLPESAKDKKEEEIVSYE